MPRGTARKLLSQRRPVDVFELLDTIPKQYVYCFKTSRVRDKKTGAFVHWPNPFHNKKQKSDRLEALREQRNARIEQRRIAKEREQARRLKEEIRLKVHAEKLDQRGQAIVDGRLTVKTKGNTRIARGIMKLKDILK